MKNTQQLKYDSAFASAQAGGMTSDDSHEFATDQAARVNTNETRFAKFKAALEHQTGDRAALAVDGQIVIARNEFSPERWFASLQQAIDHFSRYMPEELTRH